MNPLLPSPSELFRTVLTVSELNNMTRRLLESSWPLLWIKGEISNLKCYPSGHWYFSLKDTDAQVRCVIFSHKNRYLGWEPKDGIQAEVLATVTLYEPRGDFQLNVESIRRAGLGELFEAFEKLKAKLELAGLFDPATKKALPAFPRQIGIVTSPETAALHDVLTTLRRRMPSIPVIIYPAPVQGKTAAAGIAQAIQAANRRSECDVLILCRGGGSIEDLWAFNEEVVANAIAASAIPLVSGIGHEIDFTIADFVADRRAPTPTAAAEMVSRDRQELNQHINGQQLRLHRALRNLIERTMQRLDILSHRLIYPGDRIRQQMLQLQHLSDRLYKTCGYQLDKKQWRLLELQQRIVARRPDLDRFEQQLQQTDLRFRNGYMQYFAIRELQLQHARTLLAQLNPQSVLERGYSITYTQAGTIVSDSQQLRADERIQVKFAHGSCDARVDDTTDF
ncbi:MAG: exodeoxyribonuclease VII large subunit [Nitrosomonas sp.]|nr:MAG: exodeoxyribonuclease VII large subunit [Nitrosomonas sp.]